MICLFSYYLHRHHFFPIFSFQKIKKYYRRLQTPNPLECIRSLTRGSITHYFLILGNFEHVLRKTICQKLHINVFKKIVILFFFLFMSQYPSSSSTKAHNILHKIDLLSTLERTDVIFLRVPLQYETRHQRKSSVCFIRLLNCVRDYIEWCDERKCKKAPG